MRQLQGGFLPKSNLPREGQMTLPFAGER